MGCDGGTIPKRDELVKTKKKREQKDKGSELAFRWQHCAVSQQPLQQPVVADELGRMYNKESIIETILEKSAVTSAPSTSTSAPQSIATHIKSLRDVKTLIFTENPAWSEASTIEKGDGYIDMLKSRWICPVGGQEMNGRFRFIFIWTCGCVLSERALKETNKNKKEISQSECPKCQKPYEINDVIQLNPTENEEILLLQNKMEARRAVAKELKKGKKRQNKIETVSTSADVVENGISTELPVKKPKMDAHGQKDVKIPKMTKLTGTYSVAKDPNASDTYKSIFTSSDKAKDQQKAHWVTYNPFYN